MTTASSGASAASRSTSTRSASKGGPSAATSAKPSPRRAQPKPPKTPGAARIIAIANQKGGVGKSTTAVSLGAALADLGYRVLVVDLDPQGNASTGMGIRHDARDITVYDVVVGEAPVAGAVVPTQVKGLFAIPSTIDLAGAEIELVSQFSREGRLKKALEAVSEGVYDFIFLDCPPSLGLLTVNALTAADELIVPIQCEYYALEGLGQLLRNVSLVQQNINPGLRLTGIVMTMFDPRTKLSEQVVAEVRKYFGETVYDIIIPRTVRLSEAPGFGQPITVYDPKSKGAECYRELAREVALRPPPDEPMPIFDDLPTVVVPAVVDPAPESPSDDEESLDVPIAEDGAEARDADRGPEPEAPPSEPEAEVPPQDFTDSVDAAVLAAEAIEMPVSDEPTVPDAETSVEPDRDDEVWEEADEPPGRPADRVSTPRSPAPPGHLPERRVVVIDEDADLDASRRSERSAGPGPQPDEPTAHAAVAKIGATLGDDGEQPKRRWRLFRKGGE